MWEIILGVHLSDKIFYLLFALKMRGFKLLFCSLIIGLFSILSFSSADDVDHIIPFYLKYPSFTKSFTNQTNWLNNTFALNSLGFKFSDNYINWNVSSTNITLCSYIETDYTGSLNLQIQIPYTYFVKSSAAFTNATMSFQFTKTWVLSWVCVDKSIASRNKNNYFAFDNTWVVSSNMSMFNNFRFWFAPLEDTNSYPFTFVWPISFTWYFTINWNEVWEFFELSSSSSVDCSQDSNYLQCLEDKNILIWQVSTISWSLVSCQSDLSSCRGWQDASLLACIDQKEQCETSLSTLSWNYESLSNMNTSLSDQLQECLETSNLTGDLLCNKFDLIWSSENTNYSFPINNDLFLPSWYKGFVNEGVLAIKQDTSLTSAYSVSDEDFQEVMNSYGVLLLYLFGCGLFLVFLYMIRKYFIWLKS